MVVANGTEYPISVRVCARARFFLLRKPSSFCALVIVEKFDQREAFYSVEHP